MEKFDLAVIGGGPAGITAAVQACRSDLTVALFEKARLGGLLHNANLVENFPAGESGLSGQALVEIFQKHLDRFDVNLITGEVTGLELTEEDRFIIRTQDKGYIARSVIMATGTVPKKLELPGAEDVRSGRICYEISELYPVPEGKEYAIIGGGDAANDYALQLARYKNKITILIRGEGPSCLPLLERRVTEKTDYISVNTEVEAIRVEEDTHQDKLVIHFEHEGESDKIMVDNLLIAVGRIQNDRLLSVCSQKSSCTIRTELNGKTNIPGLYLAGDVMRGTHRQVGIAVGDGLSAAMSAVEYLAGVSPK